jgi:superfamily II DNA or RNA helicase
MTSNQEKGLLYEKYVRDFIIEKLHKKAYLWNECPENILIQNNLVSSHNDARLMRKELKAGTVHNHKDIGIDVIQIEVTVDTGEEDTICSMVQCKNGYVKGITIENISGIMLRTAAQDTNAFIYYTDRLSSNIKYVLQNSKYAKFLDSKKVIELCSSEDYEYEAKMKYFVKLPIQSPIEVTEICPAMEAYDYQKNAVAAFNKHFIADNQNRGILSLPCGCGKTYTSYLISNEYDKIVILSPLKAFANQNLNRYIEYGYDSNKTLLVDSDGERNVIEIKSFINGNNTMLISSTYKSMDLLSECLDLFDKDKTLFIVDEFHNLTKTNVNNDSDPIFKLLMSDHRILFMSATPRIYDLECDNELYDMEDLFGTIVYSMTMTDAIKNKYICDYRIWLPSVHENNGELNKELSIYEIDDALKNRCKYLYSCISNNGSRKCIIYCKDTEDMKAMMECIRALNDFYCMNIEMNSISCEASDKQRKERLTKFSVESEAVQLLFNIKILNECIDVPACDSVYISYAPKNKITTIQRICRANRIISSNPFKVANIFIWCNEYEEILDTLSSIKEFDIMFKDKIKINEVDFFNSREKKDIDLITNDKILLKDFTLGIKEFRAKTWKDKLQMLQNYLQQNGKLPSSESEDPKTRQLGLWNLTQKRDYKNKTMKIKERKELWKNFTTQNNQLYRTRERIWLDHLNNLEIHIKDKRSLPSEEDKKDIRLKKLGKWCSEQRLHYKNSKGILKYENIRNIWFKFTQRYTDLFMSEEEQWKHKLAKAEDYIDTHQKLPQINDTEEIKSLAKWLYRQNENYKNDKGMLNIDELRQIWRQFLDKYKAYRFRRFMTQEEYWLCSLNDLEQYIIRNNRLPAHHINSSLKSWMTTQLRNYKNNAEAMNNESIRQHWENFLQRYPQYF